MEELDFVGPFEALAYINKLIPQSARVSIIAKTKEAVRCYNGLRVLPDITMAEAPYCDVLLIPGGQGRHQAMYDSELISFVKAQANHTRYLCSVCTGSFVLGEAGLLKGRKATSHYSALPELASRYPDTTVLKERVVDQGDVLTAAGISSGIDLAFLLIAKLFGREYADQVAERMEYTMNIEV